VGDLDDTEECQRVVRARLARLEDRREALLGFTSPAEVGVGEGADEEPVVAIRAVAAIGLLRRGDGAERITLFVEDERAPQVLRCPRLHVKNSRTLDAAPACGTQTSANSKTIASARTRHHAFCRSSTVLPSGSLIQSCGPSSRNSMPRLFSTSFVAS